MQFIFLENSSFGKFKIILHVIIYNHVECSNHTYSDSLKEIFETFSEFLLIEIKIFQLVLCSVILKLIF